jgi:hypothetical protein
MAIVKIRIENVLEIPLAYNRAIDFYQNDTGRDIWDAKIELKQINFERNFRGSIFECVFEINEGNFLYRQAKT